MFNYILHMVHGIYYGIQYEIFLTKVIDFYDDLLPIWIETRAKIEMEKDKLIVIPYKNIRYQPNDNSIFKSYIRENDEYKGMHTECDLRTKKFVMVKLYEQLIRHNANLPIPITKKEFNQLSFECQRLNNIDRFGKDLSQEEWREHDIKRNDIYSQIHVQRIIHDPEYFEEIKSLHTQILEEVCFTEEQRELIDKVISHPKLDGIIRWHGLTLIDGFW